MSSANERAQAREARRADAKRRSPADADEPMHDGDASPVESAGEAVKQAASAAVVAAAVGAAQALARRRHESATEAEDETSDDEPVAEVEQPEPEPEEDDDPPAAEQPPVRPEPSPRRAEAGQAQEMAQRARAALRDLRGVEAESVSSIARSADGWRVGLEVLEVERIPESTDVLATYEVELDDDGVLLGFERTRRYYRAEADR